MSKDRSASTFSDQLAGYEEFQIKKQGFVSIQEKRVFQTWKKFWLVFRHMDSGKTPRVVLDAYINESQFRLGSSAKHTFNLTGTVAPVVICPQSHKQVRHIFVVCPPGSRYLFECDSHFGMESWVEDLNECLFPKKTGLDHILTELHTSIKLTGSIRHRTKSNSMNDISKIGSDPPEVPVAPPLPPPNKKTIGSATSYPVSPTNTCRSNSSSSSSSSTDKEAVSKYRVEIEVSTLSQIPKGVCIVLIRRENIQICHAVTLCSMATWHITHIREFKLTNDDKLIITSGNRSFTGYGQVRMSGVDCRALYYKVKIFVKSKSKNPRTAVTLPDRKCVAPMLQTKSSTLDGDIGTNGITAMTSPPESPSRLNDTNTVQKQNDKSSRPLPDIPPELQYKVPIPLPLSPSQIENYSKLKHPEAMLNWPKNQTNPFANIEQSPTRESEYSQLSIDSYLQQTDDTYNVTNHLNNQVVYRNPGKNSSQGIQQNILDSLIHINLIAKSKIVRKSEALFDFSASCGSDSSTNPYEIESLNEVRKSKSLISSQANKRHPKRAVASYEETIQRSGDSDSDTEISLCDNVAYGTVDRPPAGTIPVSPYIVTKPFLPPKPKKY